VIAIITAAATGLLAIAVRRSLDAHDAARMVRVRAAAESTIRAVLAYWNADSMRAMATGATRSLPVPPGPFPGGVARQVTAERLDARRFLVHAVARHAAGIRGAATAAAVAIVTTVPTDSIWRDFYAALAAAGDVHLDAGAIVSGIDGGVPAAWSATDCPSGLAALIAALLGGPHRPGIALPAAGASVTATGATLAGLPPVWTGAPATDTTDFARLGPLPLAEVATIADRTESGSVRLASSAAGGICDRRAPGNWGRPDDPADPCFDFVPLIFSGSDLEITAGVGQGILVVEGTVTFRSGTAFTGLILATGRVELDGARVTGAVRAAAGARIDGVVESSACVVGRVLSRTRALRKPYRQGTRLWLPPF
jgi:hypothetical protein